MYFYRKLTNNKTAMKPKHEKIYIITVQNFFLIFKQRIKILFKPLLSIVKILNKQQQKFSRWGGIKRKKPFAERKTKTLFIPKWKGENVKN